MSVLARKSVDRPAETSLALLQELLGNDHPQNFSVRLWDGAVWEATPGKPARFTLVIKRPGALRRMFLRPNQLTLGEAYINGDFDIEGDIIEAFTLADHLLDTRRTLGDKIRLRGQLLSLPSNDQPHSTRNKVRLYGLPHSKKRDHQAVTYHYDVSNDFFKLWLDDRMIYSCAYFHTPEDALDTAQEQKLDHICRKLRLKHGERLLDIGCGWGGLVMHAARNYGVKACGITLSRPQAEEANERIGKEGLSDRCHVEVCDYRDVAEPDGYDKLVSVGMFEHVGKARLPEYFKHAWRLLRPGGVFLNHGIASSLSQPTSDDQSFMDRYVFPDGELLPICITLETAERCSFEIRDLENLREHYALTLRHWIDRLAARHHEARRAASEETCRIWRLYMAGSAYGFQIGRLNLYQALLAKPDHGECRLPLTRADWYS